jgi:two-component system NtrC family response regulator
VKVPPLRQRAGDVVVLARYFMEKYATQQGKSIRGLSPDAVQALEHHSWPGNVRELENKIKTAVVMAEGDRVTAVDLSLTAGSGGGSESYLNLKAVRAKAESVALVRALSISHGNVSRAAELLGISRPTLYDLVARYEIADLTDPAENA